MRLNDWKAQAMRFEDIDRDVLAKIEREQDAQRPAGLPGSPVRRDGDVGSSPTGALPSRPAEREQ